MGKKESLKSQVASAVGKAIEKFNKDKIEANLTTLTDKFTDFASNCQEVVEYIEENVKPQGNLYGEGASDLLKAWIPNIGSAQEFIDNFENWLTYVRLELEEIKNMDDDLKANLAKHQANNSQN